MPLSIRDLDEVLTRRYTPAGATCIYSVFFLLVAGAIIGFTYSQFKEHSPPPTVTVVTERNVRPERAAPPETKPQSNNAIKEALTAFTARLEILKIHWKPTKDGAHVVTALVAVVSKFQRSGVIMTFASSEGMRLETLRPLNGQPTVHGPLPTAGYKTGAEIMKTGRPEPYSHYIQRPWGIYMIELRMEKPAPIQFSYRFEGEQESDPARWNPH